MERPIYFYFINLSTFHGSGDAVWLAEDGHVTIQSAQKDVSLIYRLELPQAEAGRIKRVLGSLSPESLRHKLRPGIPDEVLLKFGYRGPDGKLHSFSAWEDDGSNGPEALKLFLGITRKLIARVSGKKPVRSRKFIAGELQVEKPAGFAPQEVDRVLK